MIELIDFESYPVNLVKRILLKDKATKQNIIWATNSYEHLGFEYSDNSQIQEYLISKINKWIVQPRVQKSVEQQQKRTRTKAEVFTPAWLCNKMNNLCDEQWFSKADVFNTEVDRDWQTNPEKIEFSYNKGWQKYIDQRILEITCGEAPYLCSRYDMSSGQIITINNRIGILDRKLRVINENTTNKEEWYKWVIRAFQSCYGYEYQGDSLLIARINMLLSFYEYYKDRWNEEPSKNQLKKIANIISWNLWQMDGLKGTVPNGAPNKVNEQLRINGFTNTKNVEIENYECKLYNWRADRSLYYSDLKGVKRKMKFDFAIGNPPYMVEDKKDTTPKSSEQKVTRTSAVPVYQYFMTEAKKISNAWILITPSRWMTGGRGLDKFRKENISDEHYSQIHDYENDRDVFPNNDIGGGVMISLWDKNHNGKLDYYAYNRDDIVHTKRMLNTGNDIVIRDYKSSIILSKIDSSNSFSSIVSSRKPYGFPADTTRKSPELYSDEKNKQFNVKFYCWDGKPMIKYISINSIVNKKSVEAWKVFLSKTADPPMRFGRENKEILRLPFLGEPLTACSETYLVVGESQTKSEAKNVMKYIKSKFLRFLVLQRKKTQNVSRGVFDLVPLQDFTENSDIDWSKSIHEIDLQLYKKYNLDDTEIEFIEKNVKEMS